MKKTAITIIKDIQNAGFEAYFVGGCVRDEIMGVEPKDYDIVTNASAEQIKQVFAEDKILTIGEAFSIISVVRKGIAFEIASFRTDDYEDGKQTGVSAASTIEQDLARRDFTMNAVAYDPIADVYIDPFNGRQDIENDRLQFVGCAIERIKEDPARILRAFRFEAVQGVRIDMDSIFAINEFLSENNIMDFIAQERITAEFEKMFSNPGNRFDVAIRQMIKSGLLQQIIPEVKDMIDVQHNSPFHQETLMELKNSIMAHTIMVIQEARKIVAEEQFSKQEKKIVMMAALFHDFGKPAVVKFDEQKNRNTFFAHDTVGAEIVEIIMKRMRFDNDTIKAVVEIVAVHQKAHTMVQSKNIAKKRRFFGRDDIKMVSAVVTADERGRKVAPENEGVAFRGFEAEMNKQFPEMMPVPHFTGKDFIQMGFKPGPNFKRVIEICFDAQLRGDSKESIEKHIPGFFKSFK